MRRKEEEEEEEEGCSDMDASSHNGSDGGSVPVQTGEEARFRRSDPEKPSSETKGGWRFWSRPLLNATMQNNKTTINENNNNQ